MAKHKTPLLDQLESGPWPSFVSDLKALAEERTKNPKKIDFQVPVDVVDDLLGLLELSFKDGATHWKHGGIVGVFGYGGGVIGRYCDQPEMFPGVAHFHTMRVNQPGGKFYTTEYLRNLCDLWDLRGSGMTNMHGSTGDIIFLGTRTDQLEEIFFELTHKFNQDLGGSGSNLRTPSDCIGAARCEYACYDTQDLCFTMTKDYQDELHRPAFPYKFKFKFDGCPNCCVASIARSDMSFIGTWRDDIRIDQDGVKAYEKAGLNIERDVCGRCPAKCMEWNGKLAIDNRACVRCMHCINAMPKALRPGVDAGVTLLVGSKAPIVQGALLSSVLVPFMKLEPPYKELKDLIGKMWEWWDENGKNRERIGELIQRMGMRNFLDAIEVEPHPDMVFHPRANPYVFYDEYFVAEEEEKS